VSLEVSVAHRDAAESLRYDPVGKSSLGVRVKAMCSSLDCFPLFGNHLLASYKALVKTE
jgi:hypothetical protein